MNYLKHYIKLVKSRKSMKSVRKNVGNFELHHIFPISIFGKNRKTVKLTTKEHFIAHKLIVKIYEKRYGLADSRTRKMQMAFFWMIYGKNSTIRNDITFTSYDYELARASCKNSKSGFSRSDMLGKRYFGASEDKIRSGIKKMILSKTGVKTNYPKNRKSRDKNIITYKKISEFRKKTKDKFLEMSDDEFGIWLKLHDKPTKSGRINGNVTRAKIWRSELN